MHNLFTAAENLFASYGAAVLDHKLTAHCSRWLFMNPKGNTGETPLTDKWKSDKQVLIMVMFNKLGCGKNVAS